MRRRWWLAVAAVGFLLVLLAAGLIWRNLSVERSVPLDPAQMRLQSATVLDDDRPLPEDVFAFGVASGDPAPDGVVLWTRLAPGDGIAVPSLRA